MNIYRVALSIEKNSIDASIKNIELDGIFSNQEFEFEVKSVELKFKQLQKFRVKIIKRIIEKMEIQENDSMNEKCFVELHSIEKPLYTGKLSSSLGYNSYVESIEEYLTEAVKYQFKVTQQMLLNEENKKIIEMLECQIENEYTILETLFKAILHYKKFKLEKTYVLMRELLKSNILNESGEISDIYKDICDRIKGLLGG